MKQKLLGLIDSGRDKESAALVPLVDDAEPAVAGQWTAKDVVAHLMSWRRVATGELEAVRTGAAAPEVSTDDDKENVKFYAQTHPLPARTILQLAESSWTELAAAVDKLSEDQLQGPRPRYPTQPLWLAINGNSYYHVAEHLVYWHSDRGDMAEAEKAAIWGHDVVWATFTDDRQRGSAEYNLGCYYARVGRANAALPHLARGLQFRPDLRDWASKDSDLDPIRSSPELAKLLA